LFFEVLAKRDDGYHEIETLMAPLGYFDTLSLIDAPDGRISLQSHWAEPRSQAAVVLGAIPAGAANIVVRAVELLRQRAGSARGAAIRLTKRIPAMAGLGGGSSDAAAALLAANRTWNLGWSREQLSGLAAELGSDVPFFLTSFLKSGAAICRGRGEQIEPLAANGALAAVVVCPPQGLSTPAVYENCRPADRPRSVAELVRAWSAGNAGRVGRLLHNQLQPAAERLSPWIGRLREEFGKLDFLGHQMSGSGTSYFGLCRHARQAARLARILHSRGLGRAFSARCG
jgi:4-diphosphocytidyl-2-C-methyl-D-erythritol kinase